MMTLDLALLSVFGLLRHAMDSLSIDIKTQDHVCGGQLRTCAATLAMRTRCQFVTAHFPVLASIALQNLAYGCARYGPL
jgi:hypothetical protein